MKAGEACCVISDKDLEEHEGGKWRKKGNYGQLTGFFFFSGDQHRDETR